MYLSPLFGLRFGEAAAFEGVDEEVPGCGNEDDKEEPKSEGKD